MVKCHGVLKQITMVCHSLPCNVMVYHVIPWYTIIYFHKGTPLHLDSLPGGFTKPRERESRISETGKTGKRGLAYLTFARFREFAEKRV